LMSIFDKWSKKVGIAQELNNEFEKMKIRLKSI